MKVLKIPGWEAIEFDERKWATGSFVYLRGSMLSGTYIFLVVSTGSQSSDQHMIRIYDLEHKTFHNLHETATTKDITLSSASSEALLYWVSARDDTGPRTLMLVRPTADSLMSAGSARSAASTRCTVLTTTVGSSEEIKVCCHIFCFLM